MRTIRRQLLIYLMGGLLVTTLIATFATYVEVRHEANELFDYQLTQIVAALPNEIPADLVLPLDKDEDEQITVLVWNTAGTLVFASGPATQMPRVPGFGFKTVVMNGKKWRVYSQGNQQRVIQVAQLKSERNELAASMAFRALLPFLLLMPVMALLIWLVVGRSLSPLHQLAQDVSRRSPDTLTPLPEEPYPPELRPMLAALNNLLARLDQALATQRAFVADAAHELRTPLAALQLQLQLVERENSGPQAAPGFRKLHERLDRATHLVRQLLTLARQERHAGEPPHRKLDLQALIASTVSDHAPQAESKGVDLGLVTPSGASAHPVIVSGDQDNLRIMLGNLIDNAIRYTPQGGRVDVSVTASDDDILLLVADNGPGIPQEDRRRVFDRFYRREGNGESGSGLGLFIAQTIAERHGATIVLDSTDGNGGLSATVRFPALRTDAEQTAPLTQQDQSR